MFAPAAVTPAHGGARHPERDGHRFGAVRPGAAPEHALSSSQVVDRLRRERPHLDWRRLTYTVRSPLDRRLPLGVPPQAEHLRFAVVAGLALAAGMVLGRMLPR